MAEGVAKYFAASIKPVVEFCLANDINIMQMPCPETLCDTGGLGRMPHGKAWYEQRKLRDKASEIAKGQASYMAMLAARGYDILGVIGVDFSPACAVNYLNKGRSIVKGEGIYVEELKSELKSFGLEPVFVGVSGRWPKKIARDLTALLATRDVVLTL
jgi:predicted secreted protein